MLASITPLGERGRHSRWTVTVMAFGLGATGAGALAGILLGGLGSVALPATLGARARLGVLAAALLVAVMLDGVPRRVPGPRRQVNERWLDEFRGWVYGIGFGSQLGLGMATVVTSAATYVAALAALLSGSGPHGAMILGVYGLIRGATPLAAAGVRSPAALRAMHLRLEHWRGPVMRATALLLAVMFVSCLGAMR